jgi:AraC-like DNA-binding protein
MPVIFMINGQHGRGGCPSHSQRVAGRDKELPDCDNQGIPRFVKPGYHYFEVGEREIGTGLYLTSVGWRGVRSGESYPPPGHPEDYDFSWTRGRLLTDTALVFIGTGRGEFETRHGGKSDWLPGQAVLLPPGMWHRYRPLRDTGWTECWLTLSGELAGRLWQQWEGSLAVRPLPVDGAAEYLQDFERFIAMVMHGSGGGPGGARPQSLTWLAAGLDLLGRFVEQHMESEPVVASDDGVEQALRFIRNHSHRPLSVRQVAEAVGMTRRTLERRFAQSVGRTPREELELLRVRRARKLLMDTRRPVKEIAYLCGFREPRGLIRACRRWLGMVPGKLRASADAGE